jgi:DNA-binding response OmpR family regulator
MTTPRTLLIADDDPLARRALAGILAQAGYDVLTATDGAQAWDIMQGAAPPPVVVLDWMMPGLDGPAVLRQIRADPRLANTYVLFLTVKQAPGDISASLDAGAQDFVSKPFEPEELLARINVAFRTVELQEQLARRVRELEEALRRISQLEGILPICSRCKKIRDAGNQWTTVEHYLTDHAPVTFTHGFCPECYQAMLAEVDRMDR